MTLMFPSTEHRATSIAPRTVARRFRLSVRCAKCFANALTGIEMIDEPEDHADETDFMTSGAVHRVEWSCERCGSESFTVLQTHYLRAPTDV